MGTGADEAAGEVHPLLLAAGESGRRQEVQAARDVELQQQGLGAGTGGIGCQAARGFGNDVERGDSRHHAQELADIAERSRAYLHDGARRGGGEVELRAVMAHPGWAGIGR